MSYEQSEPIYGTTSVPSYAPPPVAGAGYMSGQPTTGLQYSASTTAMGAGMGSTGTFIKFN